MNSAVGVEILNHCIKAPKTGREVKYLNSDKRALLEGHDDAILREPEVEPVVDLPADAQPPEEFLQLVEAEGPDTVSHVRSVLAAEAATPEPRAPEPQPVAVQGCRLHPLFDLDA